MERIGNPQLSEVSYNHIQGPGTQGDHDFRGVQRNFQLDTGAILVMFLNLKLTTIIAIILLCEDTPT